MAACDGDGLSAGFASAMSTLGFARNQPLAVAFSGGGDSTALLALAVRHASAAPVLALIVDHALRAESGAEARRAAAAAKSLGAKARIMRWRTPQAGQARARTARYGLLAQGCRDFGVRDVLLAHTVEDQEETFALRLARGSSARGLACMSAHAPLPLWPQGRGLWLGRPLLRCGREQLRRWLQAQGLAWIEDPSNQNRRYQRVRVRQHLDRLRRGGLGAACIARSVQRLAALEQERRRQGAVMLNTSVRWHDAGYAVVDLEPFVQGNDEILACVLAAVLAGVSGQGALPLSHYKARQLAQLLQPGSSCVRSLAGCRVHSDGKTVLVSRDAGAVLGRRNNPEGRMTAVHAGDRVIFDDRFAIIAATAATITALGDRTAQLPAAQRQALNAVPAAVRRTVPVLDDGAGRLDAPMLGGPHGAQFLGREIALRMLAPFSQGWT